MNIKKGDTVQIISGKDSGKSGKVMNVDRKEMTVILDGLNLFKKHVRPKKQGEKGQVVSLPRPLKFSKIMLFCSSCRKAVRIGMKFEGDNKVRYCRKCKNTI